MIGKKTLNIGLITKDIGDAGITPLKNIVDILMDLSNCLYVITGNRILNNFNDQFKPYHLIGFNDKKFENIFLKILKNFHVQMSISFEIIKSFNKVDKWIFFLDSHAFILPIFITKILSKEIVILMAASIKNSAKSQKDPFTYFLILSEYVALKWANKIIVYSPALIKKWNLEDYQNKINIAHRHILNFDEFKIMNKIDSRKNIVGFIGRLSHEKGILPFLESIKKISLKRDDIEFLIIGNGPLKYEVELFIKQNNLKKTSFFGWVNHDILPYYLNQMKILVLPSYSEGLPNVMIESLGCGTPVLVSNVGSIPDFIIESENGFIMENNSPECIEKNIIRVIECEHLENITLNALKFAKREFEKENIVGKWKLILNY